MKQSANRMSKKVASFWKFYKGIRINKIKQLVSLLIFITMSFSLIQPVIGESVTIEETTHPQTNRVSDEFDGDNLPLMKWPLVDAYRTVLSYPNSEWTWGYLGLNSDRECPPYGLHGLNQSEGYWRNPSLPEPQDRLQASPSDTGYVACYDNNPNDPNRPPHEGTDISAVIGTPIYAVADGRYLDRSDTGCVDDCRITFEHRREVDGVTYVWQVRYVHLKENFPKMGAVSEGDIIGYIGNTSTPHVHFEVEALEGGIYDGNCDGNCVINPWGYESNNGNLVNLWVGNTYPCTTQFVPGTIGSFCDVPTSHTFYDDIRFLAGLSIVNGFSDGLFHPERSITREQVALILFRWIYSGGNSPRFNENPCASGNVPFPDLEEYCNAGVAGEEIVNAVYDLKRRGMVNGFSDGTFRPQESITRGEVMKMIIEYLRDARPNENVLQDPSFLGGVSDFDDTENSPHKDYIYTGRIIGLVNGYDGNVFRPDDPINRGEFAKITALAIYYKISAETTILSEVESRGLAYDAILASTSITQSDNQIERDTLASGVNCFPAIAGASIPGLTITEDDTPVCYWSVDDTYRIISDVAPTYWSRPNIEQLFNFGISVGCNQSNGALFCPERATSRLETIIFMLRANHYETTGELGTNFVPPNATSQIFDDVALSHPYVDWINHAYAIGLTQGAPDCGAGFNFCPDLEVNRLQVALFLLRMKEGADYIASLPHGLGIFEDMPATDQYASPIEELYWRGITQGSPDCGSDFNYCPGNSVSRGHMAAFLARTFIQPPVPTQRQGDLCFSTTGSYDVPKINGGHVIPNIRDEDIVCFHENIQQFKMYFNGSVNGIDDIEINAFTLPNDGEIWFSTNSTEIIPGIGEVRDEDIVIYEEGSYRLEIDGSDIVELASEDIDMLHRSSSSRIYLSITGGGDFGFDVDDEDIHRFNPNNDSFDQFFEGDSAGVVTDVNAGHIESYSSSESILYLSLQTPACVPTVNDILCVEEGDVIRFVGETGTTTNGVFSQAPCFDASQYPGVSAVNINGLHIKSADDCLIDLPLPEASTILFVNEPVLDFGSVESGVSLDPLSFSIENQGAGTLYWTATENTTWLSLNQYDGTAPNSIDVSVDTVGLAPGTYMANIIITSNANNGSQQISVSLEITGTEPTEETACLSFSKSGVIDSIIYEDEDILCYEFDNQTWQVYFDGSDVGLTTVDVDAFTMLEDTSLLMSLSKDYNVPGIGIVDNSDIIRFVPIALGNDTDGSFEMYFDGSDMDLTTNGENIDALHVMINGDLLLSFSGIFRVNGITLNGKDEDLILFSPTDLGENTSGTWSGYFDGSDVGLSETKYEDIWGIWIDEDSNEHYLTSNGEFNVENVNGTGADIFVCNAEQLGHGHDTVCTFNSELYWDSSLYNVEGAVIDGIHLIR